MPFASATTEKVIAHLGHPYTSASVSLVNSALAATFSALGESSVVRIEGWLSQIDTIATAIITQRSTEGSTILPELRREGRRHVQLVANALDLDISMDTFGVSGT
jgi:hypothetical protein